MFRNVSIVNNLKATSEGFWLGRNKSHHLPRNATQTFPIRRFPKHHSMSVLSSFCLAQLHSWYCTKLLLFDHDDQQKFLESCDFAKELTPSSPILRNKTFSPNCAIGFLHLQPILLISLVFPSLPILMSFMTGTAKRGSQLSSGLSSAIRTLVFCSAENRRVLHCRFTSLAAISTRPLAT